MNSVEIPTGILSVLKPESVHRWEINNFDLDNWKTGEKVVSPLFSASGLKWQIHLFPKGKDRRYKNEVSVLLKSLNDQDVTIDYDLSILDNQNKRIWRCGGIILLKDQSACGRLSFIRQDLVREHLSFWSPNNTLVILCEVTMQMDSHDEQNNSSISIPDAGIMREMNKCGYFERFLYQERFSDVKFIVDGGCVYAHKMILSLESEVFADMFAHDKGGNLTSKVEIEGIDYEIFMEMLRFIYTGKVNNMEGAAKKLYIAADKYAVGELRLACLNILSSSLCNENAVERLKFSVSYHANTLRTKAIDFIVTHLKDVVHKPEFTAIGGLPAGVLIEIFQRLAAKGSEPLTKKTKKY